MKGEVLCYSADIGDICVMSAVFIYLNCSHLSSWIYSKLASELARDAYSPAETGGSAFHYCLCFI